jgi:peptide/nickel transport system permease protein
MKRYLLVRVVQALLVLLAAYTLAFVLLSALPGDAVSNRAQDPEAQLTPEAAQQLVEYYGMDQPLWRQYLSGLGGLFTGDLGYSLTYGQPVTGLIGSALPSTLKFTGLSLLFGIALAVVVSLAANYSRRQWLRSLFNALPPLFVSVPTFVLGILVLQVLSFELHLVPAADNGSFTALIAPAAVLGVMTAGPLAQVFTGSIGTTRAKPFIRTLKARGADDRYAFRRGVLRNSALPVLTLLGLSCGELIAGSVVTEAVFARNGIGSLTVSAVSTQDMPVVQGIVLVAAAAYVIVNLIVDLVYPFLDPRIISAPTAPRRFRIPAVVRTRLRHPGTGTAPVPAGALS